MYSVSCAVTRQAPSKGVVLEEWRASFPTYSAAREYLRMVEGVSLNTDRLPWGTEDHDGYLTDWGRFTIKRVNAPLRNDGSVAA